MTNEYAVSVPAELYKQCERNIENTSFESVDQYIQFILSEVVKTESSSGIKTDEDYNVDEDQLRALGYLDQ